MVRLYEHQGKQLLKTIGVPVPEGDVASTPGEAEEIAEGLDRPVVIKAQIWATGRMRAGGIKFAESPQGAGEAAGELIGATIKGFLVERVLVEERLDIEKEYYAGVIVDDSHKVKSPVLMFSTEGGVEIEEVAEKDPEKIARMNVDVFRGVKVYDAYNLALKLGVPTPLLGPLSTAIYGIYDLFGRYEARSAEINPLILTKEGGVVAADCRVVIDDAAVPRHPELGIEIARESDRPPTRLDRVAWKIEEDDYRGVAYFMQMVPKVEGEGYIGYHGIGGGGSMLGADAVLRHGLKIANYADTSGNPTAAKVYRVARIILSQPGIEGYLLSGACVASQEQWHHAHGLVRALREMLAEKPGFPVVILLAGNKEAEALEILREGLKDLPIRLELYGRERVYDVDFIAERMRALVKEYRHTKGGAG